MKVEGSKSKWFLTMIMMDVKAVAAMSTIAAAVLCAARPVVLRQERRDVTFAIITMSALMTWLNKGKRNQNGSIRI
jgi:hypothetical protein